MSNRPDGITCKDWEPTPAGGKRCRYYLDSGACQMPTRLMCVEWEKRNPHLAAHRGQELDAADRHFLGDDYEPRAQEQAGQGQALAPSGSVAAPPRAPSAIGLLGMPPATEERREPNVGANGELRLTPSEPGRTKSAAARVYAASLPGGAAGRVLFEPEPLPPAKEIPPESIEALTALGVELSFGVAPEVCAEPIVLVPKRTGADRFELTFGEAATLRLLCDAFPGARLVKLTRPEHASVRASASTCPRCLGITPGKVANGASDVPFGVSFCPPCEQACAALAAAPEQKGASEPDPFEV